LGGVVGTDVVRYDIFGIDVLVANKMESNGESGRVMISEDTKTLLDQHFPEKYAFTYNTELFISAANRHVKTFFAEYNDAESV
jgi:class 3 adenylate cyclase